MNISRKSSSSHVKHDLMSTLKSDHLMSSRESSEKKLIDLKSKLCKVLTQCYTFFTIDTSI